MKTTRVSGNVDRVNEVRKHLAASSPGEDSAGRDSLDIVSEQISGLPSEHPDKKAYASDVNELARELERLSLEEVQRLCHFIETSHFSPASIAKSYRFALRTSLKLEDELAKRAEVFRMLSRLGERILPKAVLKESDIKKHFPWIWIDALSPLNWSKTEESIKAILEAEESVDQLLLRLPLYWKKHPSIEKSLVMWLSVLPRREQAKLREWMGRRGIDPVLDQRAATECDKHFLAGV